MLGDIEYPSSAIAYTHPARLVAQAMARGLLRDFQEDFRYLELACGDATNLLALAQRFPHASFVGVDVDGQAIGRGLARAKALGADNVELLVGDLSQVSLEGEFDFVVAHGVYSWVDAATRAALLERAKTWLSSHGVLYVSYNTLPGWGLRGVLRRLMCEAAAQEVEPRAKLRAAKLTIGRLKQHVQPNNPYGALLDAELGMIQGKHDGYLLGEHLAEHNQPLFVTEFLDRAETAGFQYLGEQVPATPDGALEAEVPAQLEGVGLSTAEALRYLDVLSYRQFRATLLCHRERALTKAPELARLRDTAYLSGQLKILAKEPLLAPGESLQFETEHGVVVASEEPLQKAALLVLARAWPRGLQVAELMTAAVAELRARGLLESSPIAPQQFEDTILDLLELVARRQLELLPWTPNFATHLGERPCLPALTRLEASRGTLTTPRHEPMALDGIRAGLLPLLDGRRDAQHLVRELEALRQAGELALSSEQVELFGDPERLQSVVVSLVHEALRMGLFEARSAPRAVVASTLQH